MLAAKDKLSPPNVPEKKISDILYIYFDFPTKAESGIPFAIPFPKHDKSGVILKYFWAPPSENLNPVMISSKINKILFFLTKLVTPYSNLFSAQQNSLVQ